MGYYNFKAEESGGAKAYYLGTYSSGANIDVSAKYSDYAALTAANFVIHPSARSVSSSNIKGYTHHFDYDRDWCEVSCAGSATISAPTVSYNSTTGILSFSLTLSQSCGGGVWDDTSEVRSSSSGGVSAKVYLLPEIEEL